jgi:hypothetical protein
VRDNLELLLEMESEMASSGPRLTLTPGKMTEILHPCTIPSSRPRAWQVLVKLKNLKADIQPERSSKHTLSVEDSQEVTNTLWAFATWGAKPVERMMGQLERRAEAISGL